MTDTSKPGAAGTTGGKGIGDEMREKGAAAADAAKETARDYAARARDEAYARGETYRDYAADETSKVASALRKASEDLSQGSPQERMVGRVADEVAYAADRMRGMTLDDVMSETSSFARRHPGAFLAGAALVGFASARFLKASGRHDHDDDYASASYPPPRPMGSAGVARPMPGTAGAATGGSATGAGASPSSEPIPRPATQPAGTTSSTSPAGTPAGATSTGTGSSAGSGPAAGSTGGMSSSTLGTTPGGTGTGSSAATTGTKSPSEAGSSSSTTKKPV